ncbi:glycosyltransferase [Flavobacteriaceae bacterium R38]|nr:glycosyltransferase [Flavobacteriaceae bacterium R38]
MKIDFIISSLRDGGAERVLVILANEFADNGHDVTIVTFNDIEKYELNPKINRVRLHRNTIKNQTLRYLINLIKYYFTKKNKPDIAISFLTQTNLTSIIAARLLKIKVIACEHTNHQRTSTNSKIVTFTRKYIYRWAHKITVLTSFDIDYYKKFKSDVMVMPNPCTFEVVKENKKREKVILAVGNLDKYHIKGFDNLIEVIAPVLNTNSDWKLKFIGGGDKGLSFLQKLVDEKGVSDNVIFDGFKSNVADIMSNSEIFILSSRTEGLPMALLEAMSQGMACISYDCVSGPSDIITNNENGLLIEDQNQKKLQLGISNLITDKDLRKKLQKTAVNSIDSYKKEAIYKKWEKLISEILT